MANDDLLKAEKRFRNRDLFTENRSRVALRRGLILLLCLLVSYGVASLASDEILMLLMP